MCTEWTCLELTGREWPLRGEVLWGVVAADTREDAKQEGTRLRQRAMQAHVRRGLGQRQRARSSGGGPSLCPLGTGAPVARDPSVAAQAARCSWRGRGHLTVNWKNDPGDGRAQC